MDDYRITFDFAPKYVQFIGYTQQPVPPYYTPLDIWGWGIYSSTQYGTVTGQAMETLDTEYQQHTGFCYNLNYSYAVTYAKRSSDRKTIYWYVADKKSSRPEASAQKQLNFESYHYYWIAIG